MKTTNGRTEIWCLGYQATTAHFLKQHIVGFVLADTLRGGWCSLGSLFQSA